MCGELLIKRPGGTALLQRFQNQLLLSLRHQPTQRRIGIQIGGEGIAFTTRGHHRVQLRFAQGFAQQGRIDRFQHLDVIHFFHRFAKGRRNLQQIGGANLIRSDVIAGGMEQCRIEEQPIAFFQRQLNGVLLEEGDTAFSSQPSTA